MVDKFLRVTGSVKFLSISSLLLLLLPAGGSAGTPRPPAPPAPPTPVAARAPERPTPPDAPEADEEEARPKRAWLGVVLSEDEDGVGITGVKDGSPADKAGLKEGDKIVEIDSKKVHDADDIRHTIRALEPGDTIQVVVMREGKKKTVTTTLAEGPRPMWSGEEFRHFGPSGDFPGMHMGGMFSRTYLGVHVQGMTEELRAYFRAPRGRGVLVSRVEEDTPAGKAGLRAGDVIISVDGKGIVDRGDIGQALADKEPGDTVAVRIVRDGSEKTLDVEIAERPAPKARHGAMMRSEEPFMEDNDGDDHDHDFEMIEEGLPEDSRIEIERALRQAHEAMSRQGIQRQIEVAVEQAREAVAQHRQEIQKEIERAMKQSELARIDQEEVGRQVKRAMEMAREQMQRALEAAEQARQEAGISL